MTPVPSEPVARFLSRLQNVTTTGSQWKASCPCRNDDHNPSLSVGMGANGEVLVNCHKGMCDAQKIFESVGLDLAKDGFMPKDGYSDRPWNQPTKLNVPKKAPVVQAEPKPKTKRKLVKTYDYCDEQGNLLFQKLRYIHEDGSKSFMHRRPDPDKPGDYLFNLTDTRKVLYRLPELLKAIEQNETVWLVEGEKDADTMFDKVQQVATTSTNGAGSWSPDYTIVLASAKEVLIIADNDDVGKAHAIRVRDEINAAGGTASVWVSKHAKDVTDHVEAGYELTVEHMDELAAYTGPEMDQEEVPEQGPDDYEEEVESPETKLIEEISAILSSDKLTLTQKMSRINFAANSLMQVSFDDYGRTVNWQEFLLEEENDSYDWVIPGLLEKQERVIVVAAEGVGKTMLARQVAISCAAGLHPFTFQPMRPIRTLTIDLENPARIIRRTSRTIMENAIRMAHARTVDAHLHIHPSGLDLASTKDRIFVEQLVEKVQPQLICLGPLYKAYVDNGSLTSEALAVEVAKFLDHIRDAYGCALWLEHHAPLGASSATRELRPFGSSVWSRWPEFGISITPDPLNPEGYVYDVKHFRGARDKRAWPIKMKRSLRLPFEVIEFMKE